MQLQSLSQKSEIFDSSLYTREPLVRRKLMVTPSVWGAQSIQLSVAQNYNRKPEIQRTCR